MLLAILPFVGANKRSRAAGMLSHHRPTQGHLWSWDKPRRNNVVRRAAPFASDGIPPNQTGPIYTYVHVRGKMWPRHSWQACCSRLRLAVLRSAGQESPPPEPSASTSAMEVDTPAPEGAQGRRRIEGIAGDPWRVLPPPVPSEGGVLRSASSAHVRGSPSRGLEYVGGAWAPPRPEVQSRARPPASE